MANLLDALYISYCSHDSIIVHPDTSIAVDKEYQNAFQMNHVTNIVDLLSVDRNRAYRTNE